MIICSFNSEQIKKSVFWKKKKDQIASIIVKVVFALIIISLIISAII